MSASVLDRPASEPDFMVRYGLQPDQVADVRLPPGEVGPLALVLHGGFWRQAYDRKHLGPLGVALATAGFVVATPEYCRVGGSGGWPGTLDDVALAVRRVPRLIGEPVSGQPVVLAGHSAGGHLALWAAGGLARDGYPPAGVVALAPVAALRSAYELGLGAGAVAALLGGGPDAVGDRYAQADPIGLVPLGVRTILVHGGRDDVVPADISRQYAEAASAAGDEVDLADLPSCEHFDVIDPDSAAWPAVLAAFSRLSHPRTV
jgi:acetyl esterase/lipase